MVSDSDIIKCIHLVLKESDLSTITNSILREKLELEFGVSFSHRKDFIREQVDLFFKEDLERPQSPVADVIVGRDDDCDGVSLEKVQSPDITGFDSVPRHDVKVDEEDQEDDIKVDEEDQEDDVKVDEEDQEDDVKVDEEDQEDGEEGEEAKDLKSTVEDIRQWQVDGQVDQQVDQQVDEKGKRTPSGFHKLCSLSPQLQEFTGSTEMPRPKVVKKLWDYIKENDLQEPSNRRNIICDEKLRSIFGVSSIDMFKMNTALKIHIWPLGSECAASNTTSSWKQETLRKKRERKRMKGEESPKKKKKKKKDGSEHRTPILLSDALFSFLGAEGEPRMPKSLVMTKIWEYIKMNHLQDPSNREVVHSNSKLKELFQVDSFKDYDVPTLLSHHFLKEGEE